ncbi:MAG: hypothetical protein JXP34_07205 [Planctomycetes bacterium]|nr:hypothetical protein [Planctomycetota bacterium]
MAKPLTSPVEKLCAIIRRDPRYAPEAYHFVYEALEWTLRNVVRARRRNQHVTGPQLLEGIRQCAIEEFGCLAKTVLESWGVRSTADFGEIVFNLIDEDMMGKQPTDSKEDFAEVYDFEDAFRVRPVFRYDADEKDWHVSYETEPGMV